MEFNFSSSCVLLVVFLIGSNLVDMSNSHNNLRVAPGVPPQHYDPSMGGQQYGNAHGGHPPPPQQQQFHPNQQVPGQQQQFQQHQVPVQQQFQQQQVPVQQQQFQQQQVPVHQQQFQQPGVQPVQPSHGHMPQGGGHGHGHAPGHGQPILDTSNIGQERQHIQDHMSVPIDTSQMTEQELQFHYFKMHDADNNNKLDGCELVKSLIHWHDASNHDPKAGHAIPEQKLFPDEELINMIDPILANDDKNRDGFIDYGEFVQAQAAAAARSTQTKTA